MKTMGNNTQTAWELGEFELIQKIQGAFPDVDLTDDCGWLDYRSEEKLLLTTDAAVRGVHFPMESKYLENGGYRGLAGAISDINGSAGNPIAVLMALSIPSDLTAKEFYSFIAGIKEYSNKSRVPVIGGNITRGVDLTGTFTVIGSAKKPISRSGAQPGNLLVLTGSVGGSEAGRILLSQNNESLELNAEMLASLTQRHLRPDPPLGIGEKLANADATSMIDISDGLLADAKHISESSGVCLHIELERIPLFPGVREFSEKQAYKPEILAARSGEEFELLATIPSQNLNKLKNLKRTCTVIGRVKKGCGLEVILDGETIEPSECGWTHF